MATVESDGQKRKLISFAFGVRKCERFSADVSDEVLGHISEPEASNVMASHILVFDEPISPDLSY